MSNLCITYKILNITPWSWWQNRIFCQALINVFLAWQPFKKEKLPQTWLNCRLFFWWPRFSTRQATFLHCNKKCTFHTFHACKAVPPCTLNHYIQHNNTHITRQSDSVVCQCKLQKLYVVGQGSRCTFALLHHNGDFNGNGRFFTILVFASKINSILFSATGGLNSSHFPNIFWNSCWWTSSCMAIFFHSRTMC